MNSSRLLLPLRSSWLLTFILLCFLIPKAKTQIGDGCLVQNVDLIKCLNQSMDSMFIIRDSCCRDLNQIVQAGFNCLCSFLRASSIALVSPPLALPFSNCFISVPPLSLCQAFAPVTVLVPPDSPKEQQAHQSSPPDVLVVPSPPQEVEVPPTNLTMDRSSSTVSRQPYAKEDDDDPRLSNGAVNSNTCMCLWQTLFLSLWLSFLVSK